MEIAILGGTGDFGEGLVLRLARDAGHDVVVGSREASRAERLAARYRDELAAHDPALADRVSGQPNEVAVEDADVAIASVPPAHLRSTVETVAPSLPTGAILVSPAVALRFDETGAHYERSEAGSTTAVAADAAPDEVPVVGAFHTVSAKRLADLDRAVTGDVPVVGDDPAAREAIGDLVDDVDALRGLDAGPLEHAAAVEHLTALQITLGHHNVTLKDVGVHFE